MTRNDPYAKTINRDFTGRRILIPRIKLNKLKDEFPYTVDHIQSSVRHSFAFLINHSQGQLCQTVDVQ